MHTQLDSRLFAIDPNKFYHESRFITDDHGRPVWFALIYSDEETSDLFAQMWGHPDDEGHPQYHIESFAMNPGVSKDAGFDSLQSLCHTIAEAYGPNHEEHFLELLCRGEEAQAQLSRALDGAIAIRTPKQLLDIFRLVEAQFEDFTECSLLSLVPDLKHPSVKSVEFEIGDVDLPKTLKELRKVAGKAPAQAVILTLSGTAITLGEEGKRRGRISLYVDQEEVSATYMHLEGEEGSLSLVDSFGRDVVAALAAILE